MTITPRGRRLGGKRSPALMQDRQFSAHALFAAAPPPPETVDISPLGPPAWDQGQEGSCEFHGNAAPFAWAFGGLLISRQAAYNWGRQREDDFGKDEGCFTATAIAVMTAGVYAEDHFAYGPANLYVTPPDPSSAVTYKYDSADRCSTPEEVMAALAMDGAVPLPFAIQLPDYFDNLDQMGVSPVLITPKPGFKDIGGHCMCAVGYYQDFYSTPTFAASGLTRNDIGPFVLKVRNSWGPSFGDHGHCYIDGEYVLGDQGGDCWKPHVAPNPISDAGQPVPSYGGVLITGKEL